MPKGAFRAALELAIAVWKYCTHILIITDRSDDGMFVVATILDICPAPKAISVYGMVQPIDSSCSYVSRRALISERSRRKTMSISRPNNARPLLGPSEATCKCGV